MSSGDNIQALSKILDLIRFTSILVLLIHFYCVCYDSIQKRNLAVPIVDNMVYEFTQNVPGLYGETKPKLTVLLLLSISLLGVKGKKDDKLTVKPITLYITCGLLLFFVSSLFLQINASSDTISSIYISFTSTGYILILTGGTKISRFIRNKLQKDIFNDSAETFPQEERLIENEFSFNLPAQYKLNGKVRKSWVNFLSPTRAILVCGSPGSGKTYFCIRHFLTQSLAKNYTAFVYDYKYPDLARVAYNHTLKNIDKYKNPVKFYVINFDDLSRTHQCNCIPPQSMLDIADATESGRTIMLALNREWIKKQGDFFVESPINFVTAIFWFLKKYEGGKYCTLPHAIELAQEPYERLLPVLSLEPEISVLVNPFCSAYLNNAQEQLEGQIASAKICLARLASPSLYYVLSGDDFSLDINNPDQPKVVVVGNNPARQGIYGAVLSLYVERMLKLVNRGGQLKSSLIFDEFPTFYTNNIDNHIATARSRLCSTVIGIQDLSQLRRDYGKEQADVIVNTCGNIISGQVLGDTAKVLSDRIGKIMQERESLSINSNDTSISKSLQLESAIPPAKISNLSSGEFVGAIADTPSQKIKLKSFHCEIINDHEAIAKEEAGFQEIPVIRHIDESTVMQNFYQIKNDIKNLVDKELERIRGSTENAVDDKPKKPTRRKSKKNNASSL